MKERKAEVRQRIIRATAKLLAQGGREAASTRSVSTAAGVQAPVIYRHFGDMRGLLDAVAQATLAGYVRRKADRQPGDDPVEDLRRGWDQHVAFGLEHPAIFALVYGDPAAATASPMAREGFDSLLKLVERVAQAGRLRVSIPHAARLIAAAGEGVTLQLIASPVKDRDPKLSAAMREAVVGAITLPIVSGGTARKESDVDRVASRAVALRAVLGQAPGILSQAEQDLLGEWLDRLARQDVEQNP